MSTTENENITTGLPTEIPTEISSKQLAVVGGKRPLKVGLAFQGGGFPAGAVGAGVIKGLAESGLFGRFHSKEHKYDYDIVAFSGTSAGALLATLCWAWLIKCKAKEVPSTEQDISDLIKVAVRHATYYASPNNFAWVPIWNADQARSLNSQVTQLREVEVLGVPVFDIALQLGFAPWLHMLTRHWIEASLAAILHPEDDPFDQIFNEGDIVIDKLSPILERSPSIPPFDVFKPNIFYKTYSSWLPAVPKLYSWLRTICYADLSAYNLRKMCYGDPVSELQGLAKKLLEKNEDLPGLTIASSNIFRGENKSFGEDDLLTDGLSAVVASGSLDEVTGWTIIKTGKNEGIYLDGAWGDNPPLHAMVNSHELDEIWVVEFFPKYCNIIPNTPLKRQERRDQLWQNSLLEHEQELLKHEQAVLGREIRVRRISHNYPTEPKASLVNNPDFLQEMMNYGYAAACSFADNQLQ